MKNICVVEKGVPPFDLNIRFSLQNLKRAKEFIDQQYAVDIIDRVIKEDLSEYAKK